MVDQVMKQKFEDINIELEKFTPIKNLVEMTHVPAVVFVAIPLLIFVSAIVLDIGASFFTRLIGVGYPTFKSIIALESPSTDDDKQWLTYWCVYGLLAVLDEYSAFIL